MCAYSIACSCTRLWSTPSVYLYTAVRWSRWSAIPQTTHHSDLVPDKNDLWAFKSISQVFRPQCRRIAALHFPSMIRKVPRCESLASLQRRGTRDEGASKRRRVMSGRGSQSSMKHAAPAPPTCNESSLVFLALSKVMNGQPGENLLTTMSHR